MHQTVALNTHIDAIIKVGYTVIEGAIDQDQVATIRQALSPWLQKRLMGRNNFEGHFSERVYALLDKAPEIASLVEHEAILALVDAFLEPNYLLSSNLAINVHPGETPQPFHADHTQVPNCERHALNGISSIWALDDFTDTNGATEVIPGSHTWGRDHGISESNMETLAVQIRMPAGSVLVLHGALVHRGGANKANTTRLAITPQYCQPWLRPLENMSLAVRPEMASQYSNRIKSLLGYSVREPGFMGYVDGLHPRRRIEADYLGRHARGLPS